MAYRNDVAALELRCASLRATVRSASADLAQAQKCLAEVKERIRPVVVRDSAAMDSRSTVRLTLCSLAVLLAAGLIAHEWSTPMEQGPEFGSEARVTFGTSYAQEGAR